MTDRERAIIAEVRPYTMISPERLLANMDAVAYVVERRIPGGLVECGVWRGGSVLAMIRTLQHLGIADRDVYLFDTFEGMTAPTDADTSPIDEPAIETWKSAEGSGEKPWDNFFRAEVFNLDDVRSLLLDTGYPSERIHFVVGQVEHTLPAQAPDQVAVLRLDTDWYDSTKHELLHLYPRLSPGGVLIVDDYGHWDGSRKAVEEYLSTAAQPLLLARTDYTGRMAIKH
jgi:O-methyltransferase